MVDVHDHRAASLTYVHTRGDRGFFSHGRPFN